MITQAIPWRRLSAKQIFIGVFVLEAFTFPLLGWKWRQMRSARAESTQSQPTAVAMDSVELLAGRSDVRGNTSSPYTLVEFGDFECPPCAQADQQVRKLLASHPGKLRFDFREFPLSMHPDAQGAAIIAETARRQGKFWQVHDTLYDLDTHVKPEVVATALRRQGMGSFAKKATGDADHLRAESAVAQDIKLGYRLGIDSTPTFMLCYPDGKVVRLAGIESTNKLIQ